MSVVTSMVLVCHLSDNPTVGGLVISDHTDYQRFVDVKYVADSKVVGPRRKMLQISVNATAVNYIGSVDDLAARIETAPWRRPESVLLLVQGEDEVRPSVWGFAGAAHFDCVDQPRRFVCLIQAVPS